MPRYYFHLHDGSTISGDAGEMLATLDDAKSHALLVASQLGERQTEEHNKNRWVAVTDERDDEVFRVSLDGMRVAVDGGTLP
jgi:hypothetical protein